MESKVIEYKQDEGSDLQAGWQILQTQLFHFDIDHCLSPTAKVTRDTLLPVSGEANFISITQIKLYFTMLLVCFAVQCVGSVTGGIKCYGLAVIFLTQGINYSCMQFIIVIYSESMTVLVSTTN